MELNKSIFKSLIMIIVFLIVLLFGSNLAWLIYESQWVQVTEETTHTQTIENVETIHDIVQN